MGSTNASGFRSDYSISRNIPIGGRISPLISTLSRAWRGQVGRSTFEHIKVKGLMLGKSGRSTDVVEDQRTHGGQAWEVNVHEERSMRVS